MVSSWTRFRSEINPVVKEISNDLYTAYPLGKQEFVFERRYGNIDSIIEYLRNNGYEPQLLSAAKKHPETKQLHDLSYRSVPSEHPELIEGTKLYVNFYPKECQYHVHVFNVGGGIYQFFSHYEARPDFFEPNISLHRLSTHYKPLYGQEYFKGITDLRGNND